MQILLQTLFKLKVNLYKQCLNRQAKQENKHATTHVAKFDTMLSPRPGVTQEGHCQPGTDPTPRTTHVEQKLATQNVTVRVFVMLGIYFVSVKYVFVSVKLVCVYVKLLKI
jgi:hypothetical protein